MEIILEGNMNHLETFTKYSKMEQKYMHIIIIMTKIQMLELMH